VSTEVPAGRQLGDVHQIEDIALVDLLDRVLDTGVVVSGEVILSLADVDLVYLNLRLLLASVESLTGDGT
jgi:hypothetical protein